MAWKDSQDFRQDYPNGYSNIIKVKDIFKKYMNKLFRNVFNLYKI